MDVFFFPNCLVMFVIQNMGKSGVIERKVMKVEEDFVQYVFNCSHFAFIVSSDNGTQCGCERRMSLYCLNYR